MNQFVGTHWIVSAGCNMLFVPLFAAVLWYGIEIHEHQFCEHKQRYLTLLFGCVRFSPSCASAHGFTPLVDITLFTFYRIFFVLCTWRIPYAIPIFFLHFLITVSNSFIVQRSVTNVCHSACSVCLGFACLCPMFALLVVESVGAFWTIPLAKYHQVNPVNPIPTTVGGKMSRTMICSFHWTVSTWKYEWRGLLKQCCSSILLHLPRAVFPSSRPPPPAFKAYPMKILLTTFLLNWRSLFLSLMENGW